ASLVSDATRTEAAFGTSPPWVRNDHLLPGTTFEEIVSLTRNTTGSDMKATVDIRGDKEVKKWIKIENQDELIMKKGQEILPMKVTVKVPSRAALKNYRGDIFVVLERIKTPDDVGMVAVKLGAHIMVDLTVIGEKITDYRVKSVSLDTLEEEEPFHLNVEVENFGNTEITELNGQVDIYDSEETEILKSLTFGELTEAVSPDDIVKSQVDFEDLVLDPGSYWAVVKVFKDGDVIYENRFYQKVNPKFVPVITVEDVDAVVKRPSIPKLPEGDTELDSEEPEKFTLSPEQLAEIEVRAAASPLKPESKFFLIFGLVGLAFGMIAMISVIALLVIIIKRQNQSAIQHYISQGHYRDNNKE
ncbi:hypothetical protein ACFL6I_29200, partial [candidate division KSB1 bacterium]